MMKDKLIEGKNVVSRFRGKLVKMIKDTVSKFDDYSISPKIRQVLLHWGYELTKQSYDLQNKEAIKEESKNRYRSLSQVEKEKIREYQRKRY